VVQYRRRPGKNGWIPAVCPGSSPPSARTAGSRTSVRDPAHPAHNCRIPAVCPGSEPSTGVCPDQAHPRPQLSDPDRMSGIRANPGQSGLLVMIWPFPDYKRGWGRGPVRDCLGCWVSGGSGSWVFGGRGRCAEFPTVRWFSGKWV
jgi:hypothetical protein